MLFKIGELAQKSGVSIRTLRYYEEISLLVPKEILESGYRLYGEKEALRLQQILFYKEIGYSLKEIKKILDRKDYDLVNSLEKQKNLLLEKQKQYTLLINTINKTITNLQKGLKMNLNEMYKGFPNAKKHREEAFSLWGEKVNLAEQNLLKYQKQEFNEIVLEFNKLWKQIAESADLDPNSDIAQDLINQHFNFISIFWGIEKENIPKEQYLGLAELYLEDNRFTTIDNIDYPKMGEFLKKAMEIFSKNQWIS